MKKAQREARGPGQVRGASLSGIFRAAWIYGGIPFLVLTAILIAAQRLSGLADLLYWLGVVWMAMVRYAEAGGEAEVSLQPSRSGLRKWWRFSIILGIAAGGLYALAKIVARP